MEMSETIYELSQILPIIYDEVFPGLMGTPLLTIRLIYYILFGYACQHIFLLFSATIFGRTGTFICHKADARITVKSSPTLKRTFSYLDYSDRISQSS